MTGIDALPTGGCGLGRTFPAQARCLDAGHGALRLRSSCGRIGLLFGAPGAHRCGQAVALT